MSLMFGTKIVKIHFRNWNLLWFRNLFLNYMIQNLYVIYLWKHQIMERDVCLNNKIKKDILHPLTYHSWNLKNYKKNYAINELECLAFIDALDKFYYYVHGQKFIIHRDHVALTWVKNVKNLRGHLFCWSLKLSMFDYEIKYQKYY